jgi:3-dehydroquinate synthase
VSKESMIVKSHKGEYSVTFCENGAEHLVNNLPDQNYHIIIDKRVAELYSNELQLILDHTSVLQIDALESNKSLEVISNYVMHLVSRQVRRDDILIAIGGGIIQDITCFLAATLLRGVDWYFYPTTLLAQADSCIGSKSSINCGDSKNLLGTFTPPNKVIIGSNYLKTLDEKDVRSGVGEMLKVHGIAGIEAFDKIATEYDKLLVDSKTMQFFIRRSLDIKKEYIEIDEFDRGPRNIFNYGHSLGHAIEAATNFSIPHGIAVTIGMDMANWLSPQIGDGDMKHYNRMHNVLSRNFIGFEDIDIPIDRFISALAKDKKNVGQGEVTLILPNRHAKIKKRRCANNESFKNLCNKYLTMVRFQ